MTERDPDQAWFWTERWQLMEREADADIAAGRLVSAGSVDEMLRLLDAPNAEPQDVRKDR